MAAIAVAALLSALPAMPQPPRKQNAGAIGQIVPANGIVQLGGAPGAIVRDVRVRAGDFVKAGTLLMSLQGSAIKADVDMAGQDFRSAKSLANSQIQAQTLAVELARQQYNEASRQLNTYSSLGAQSVSAGEMARLRAVQNQAMLGVQIEQEKLKVTQSDADKSMKAATSKFTLAQSGAEIRAPADGTILRVDRRPGQSLTLDPAVQMADLRVMYVACQVYEADLLRLKRGMKATVTSATLSAPLTGTVDEIGGIVDSRSRLGDVRIRLDNVEPARHLVGMEVEVVIAH